jgi:hypothetical protein
MVAPAPAASRTGKSWAQQGKLARTAATPVSGPRSSLRSAAKAAVSADMLPPPRAIAPLNLAEFLNFTGER